MSEVYARCTYNRKMCVQQVSVCTHPVAHTLLEAPMDLSGVASFESCEMDFGKTGNFFVRMLRNDGVPTVGRQLTDYE